MLFPRVDLSAFNIFTLIASPAETLINNLETLITGTLVGIPLK